MNNIKPARKNIYLFLILACFIGIILIFVFDGYMGFYDTLTMTSGEQTQTITPEQWQDDNYPHQIYTYNPDVMSFSYEIDNRRFSSYREEIIVTLWKNQEKIADIVSENINVKAFGKDTVTWNIDARDIIPADAVESVTYTLEIQNGDNLRKTVIYITIPNSKNLFPPPALEAEK